MRVLTCAVLVPARLVQTLEPEAPSTIKSTGASLETSAVELELVAVDRPALGLVVPAKRLGTGQVTDQASTCDNC